MGDEGCELCGFSLGKRHFAEQADAISDAISPDAALRSIVRLWSTLSDDAKRVIATVAKADAGN